MRMRPIPSTGGRYWAGEDGRVYSRKRLRPLRPFHVEGYAVVNLWNGVSKVDRHVCRLVAEAWCEGFNSMTEVHHVDGDTRNDRPGNLVALSPAAHMRVHGRRVDDADFADCEAMCAEAPPPRPLLGDACRIEVLMGEAARVFERLERKGVRL